MGITKYNDIVLKTGFKVFLAVQTFYSWHCFYNAQFLPYDDNYGLLIHGYLITLIPFAIMLIVWSINRKWITANIFPIVTWLLLGSPVTLAIVVIYYPQIFHATLST